MFRNVKDRGGLADQQSDGMLELRALECDGRQLRLCCLQNSQRLRDVEVGHGSAGAQIAGQLEGTASLLSVRDIFAGSGKIMPKFTRPAVGTKNGVVDGI